MSIAARGTVTTLTLWLVDESFFFDEPTLSLAERTLSLADRSLLPAASVTARTLQLAASCLSSAASCSIPGATSHRVRACPSWNTVLHKTYVARCFRSRRYFLWTAASKQFREEAEELIRA